MYPYRLQRLGLCTLFLLLLPAAAFAQARADHLPAGGGRAEVITVTFNDAVTFPRDAAGNPAPVRALVYLEDVNDRVVQYGADAVHAPAVSGNEVVNLTNFRADPGGANTPVILADLVPVGQKRDFTIVIRNVILSGETQAKRVQVSVPVRSQVIKPPRLFMLPITSNNRDVLTIQPVGISAQNILARLGAAPGKIAVTFDFAGADTIPDTNATAVSVAADPGNPNVLLVKPSISIPRRPEPFTVTVKLPVADLRGAEDIPGGFGFPADATTLDVTREAKLVPSLPERAASEFYFEATYNSTVSQKDRKRSKVGVFGLNIRPKINPLTYNVNGAGEGAPFWLALRPFFEADIDTQSSKDSKSPNRINFGVDLEYGQNVGLARGPKFLQYFIWLNGFHHESDRDFKLRTIYWHTEFVPYFLNWEKTRDQTLHQFRYPCRPSAPTPGGAPPASCVRTLDPERAGRQPLVSAYRFRPSVGYDLGGTLNRDNREIDAPTEHISRLLFKLDTSVELKRLVTFSLENTYYFLENAERRRNRDYLETRLEFNTGRLFGNDFGGLQNAITLKFQRGDQSPTFKPVNAFSAGFKIFR